MTISPRPVQTRMGNTLATLLVAIDISMEIKNLIGEQNSDFHRSQQFTDVVICGEFALQDEGAKVIMQHVEDGDGLRE